MHCLKGKCWWTPQNTIRESKRISLKSCIARCADVLSVGWIKHFKVTNLSVKSPKLIIWIFSGIYCCGHKQFWRLYWRRKTNFNGIWKGSTVLYFRTDAGTTQMSSAVFVIFQKGFVLSRKVSRNRELGQLLLCFSLNGNIKQTLE